MLGLISLSLVPGPVPARGIPPEMKALCASFERFRWWFLQRPYDEEVRGQYGVAFSRFLLGLYACPGWAYGGYTATEHGTILLPCGVEAVHPERRQE